MKSILIALFVSTFTLSYAQNGLTGDELDLIDAYSLKVDEALLFGDIHDQLTKLGIPEKLAQQNQPKDFESSKDVESLIKSSTDFTVVTFSGIEFWCFNDMGSIPCKIDFRILGKDITSIDQTYNQEYSIEDFKKQYPNSFANSPVMPQSFFELSTQENIDGLKHFMLQRSTKSDKDVRLMVEFTFKDDNLMYIFFVNF